MITMKNMSYMAIPMVVECNKIKIPSEQRTIIEAKKEIEAIVCREMEVSVSDAYSVTNKKDIVQCRHLLFYFFRKYRLDTIVTIGRWFGKDHATVIHGLKKVREQADIYQDYRLRLEKLSIMIDLKLK